MQNESSPWINAAIGLLEKDHIILADNRIWEYNKEKAKAESFREDKDWYYGYGFSDRCFFIEAKRFYADIYNCYHTSSEMFPMYGGNAFERMINSYMRTNKLTRITNKNVYYTHEKLINDNNKFEWPGFI